MYSVLRSHGTCAGRGVDGPVPGPECPFVKAPEVLDGSARRRASSGSRVGRFSGFGFSAMRVVSGWVI